MAAPRKDRVRRTDGLSRARIVQAAIEILDSGGESALTTRALATSLSTGSGAIFHHVRGKEDLLRAAADRIIADVTSGIDETGRPVDSIRATMLGVFDAIYARPWVGAQLAREPWQVAVLDIFEGVAGDLQDLGVRTSDLFNTTSVLVNYLLGTASQYAAGARLAPGTDRATFLASAVEEWIAARDPATRPLLHDVAQEMVEHEDRAQFLDGLELILEGIASRRR